MKTLTHGELFAGISGFGTGFSRHGIKTLWHVEIDKTAQSVLRHNDPTSLILDDVRTAGAHNLSRVDIISFGSPCQDLSVAGRRKGLAGERSGLFYEAIRIVGELKPTFAIWENVPGAFSSNNGRDFAYVLAAFLECGARDIAWATLDAQHFGVPQRRRRVFVVADFAGERAGEILFIPDGGTGDIETGGEARQGIAATVSASPPSRRNGGSDPTAGHFVIPNTAYTVKGEGNWKADGADNLIGTATFTRQRTDEYTDNTNTASTLAAHDYKSATDLVIPTSADEQAVTVFTQNQREEVRDLDGIAGAIAADAGAHQQNYVAYGLATSVTPKYGVEIQPTLTQPSPSGGGQPPAVVIAFDRSKPSFNEDGITGALRVSGSATKGVNPGKPDHWCATTQTGVRRLTPTECERLQGFPDGHTALDADGSAISDSVRYRMLGNAVCANVSAWIGKRIVQVTTAQAESETAA